MKNALLILAAVLLIRLPFLNQAVQGDDVYYLAAAEHAQIDPLHPNHFHYIYDGREVDFRGYPHPPLNAWCLAGLIAIFGDVREVPFHAVWIVFSLIASFAMYSIARRFTERPVWATLLFIAAPAFVVNGNSFEADVPFLAFWMASIAVFLEAVERKSKPLLSAAVGLMVLASLEAPQAVLLIPILFFASKWRAARIASFTPVIAFAAFQLFEYASSGSFPATRAAEYQSLFQHFAAKLRNAGALTVHSLFLVSPLLSIPTVLAIRKRRDSATFFLLGWIGIFYLGALALFFAGSARYLLPMVAPVAILASSLRPAWLAVGFGTHITLSLLLATVNYQHWDAYRKFAQSLAPEAQRRRVWVNSEWGLRFYLESEGARPVVMNQEIPPGDIVVTSELGDPVPFRHGGSVIVPIARLDVRPSIPLRLIGIESHSGYSSAEKGFCPFGISGGSIDRVRAERLEPRVPTREDLPMNAPEAESQIVSGVYQLEEGRWRWMGQTATILLKSPPEPLPVHIAFYIPDASPVRTVSLTLDDRPIASRTFPGPGAYTLESEPLRLQGATARLVISLDKSFTAPPDPRPLGIILTEAGFRK